MGLTWTRAPQFRVVFHPNKRWALGLAIENPEQFIGGAVVLPSALTTSYSGQLDNGTLPSTPNVHPDILPKVAFDGHLGDRHMHIEAVGMVRSFKVFNPLSGSTSMSTGGGGSVNLNLEMFKNFHVIANSFWSDGGGRYIFGLGPDLIIRGDGTPSLVHSGSAIGGFEWQATARNMLYSYYGVGYFQRNVTVDPATGNAGWIRLCRLFFQRQSSRAGTDTRIYPHALETRKLRRAAGSHPVLLPHAQSLVRGAGRAQERSCEHGLSRFSLSAALTGGPFEVMRHMMAEKV